LDIVTAKLTADVLPPLLRPGIFFGKNPTTGAGVRVAIRCRPTKIEPGSALMKSLGTSACASQAA
jgi:hypothetical protein